MRRLLIIFFIILTYSRGYAVSYYSTTFSANTTINSVLNVSIGSSSTINFSNLTDYANGKTISPFVTITIKSNMSWTVSVMANAANFTGGNNNMPCSILSVRRNGSGASYATISSSSGYDFQNNGSRTGSTSPYTATFSVDLKANPGYDYIGGAYSIGLVYTITGS